jgi:hypothetical protein
LGYGVAVGNGAHALIERNVFDLHYHAIAADPTPRTGYRAYRNLVLDRGDAGEHQFDMHGDSQCTHFGIPSGSHDECGTAGKDVDIRHNSFLFTGGPAIKVRGTPRLTPIGAVIGSNVFAHGSLDDAVQWTGGGVLELGDNQAGVTAYAINYCDFEGDGINDLFLTTGQTWWYSSAGTGPWTYLNASTLSLQHGDISLGYFDGDNLCDVVAGGVTYSDGMPQSPQRLGPRPIPGKARLLLNQ